MKKKRDGGLATVHRIIEEQRKKREKQRKQFNAGIKILEERGFVLCDEAYDVLKISAELSYLSSGPLYGDHIKDQLIEIGFLRKVLNSKVKRKRN
jgi:hypothetical protein